MIMKLKLPCSKFLIKCINNRNSMEERTQIEFRYILDNIKIIK